MYVDQIMLPQLYDLVTTYQPDLIFSDGTLEYRPRGMILFGTRGM